MFVIEKYSIYSLCSLLTFSISLGKQRISVGLIEKYSIFFTNLPNCQYIHIEKYSISVITLWIRTWHQSFQQTKPKLLHCYMHLASDMLQLLLQID